MLNIVISLLIILCCLTMNAQQNKNIPEIIKYGSYAPSSHNAQMWSVKILEKNKFEVFPNDDRTLPYVDPNNRETWISIGAFVENCVLAAEDLGYKSDVTIYPHKVMLNFQKDSSVLNTNQNIELIKKRLTIRKPYLNECLDDMEVRRLTNLSENILYFPVHSEQGEKIINYSTIANRLQMNTLTKLKELAEWMTFSYKDEKQRKDGMTPEALGVTGYKHVLFNLFMTKKSVKGKIFINGSIHKANEQLNSCSGYVLITSNSFRNADLVESGRILERVWLECVNNKIAVQPMSQVLEEHEYYKLLKSSLKNKGEIQMLLRVGKVKEYPERIGKRLDVEDIIVE